MLDGVRIEAVVTDLDGTVVRSDFSISPATLEAVDLLRSSGIAFVVATARTPQGLEHFQVLAERTDMGVCCSGAIGWSSREKTRTWMDVMGPAVIRRVVDIAIAEGAGVASFDGTLWRMSEEYLRLESRAASWADARRRPQRSRSRRRPAAPWLCDMPMAISVASRHSSQRKRTPPH